MMYFEEIEIDGQLITVSIPATDIKVGENRAKEVSYYDATGSAQQQEFSKVSFARAFFCWLSKKSE
ncbi:MAG: hypothetical protein V7735_11270 [Photobacterium frigidiphilum]|uniref:hypothetical protein n=1 Tax=Photobacterium frigidiphilum TaxID=264736 RepID=UPI003002CBDB